MKRPYNKPALTYAQQIQQLRARGMDIADEDSARFYLQHFNYYRLGAYWLPFEIDHGSHRFKPGTRFDDVLALYIFDRELRLLVLDAIERIEVSVRSQWAYRVGHLYGPHGYLEERLAFNVQHLGWHKDDLRKEINRSDEIFIKHLVLTYVEEFPPIWAACEVMSLGLLSRWYQNLKPMQPRQLIANVYGIQSDVLGSWLHHLSIVRNICAHHSRLWDRTFTILPMVPKSKPAHLAAEFVGNRKLYNSLVVLLHLMDIISPRHHWRGRLKKHLGDHASNLPAMGFPVDWEAHSIWQEPHERKEIKP